MLTLTPKTLSSSSSSSSLHKSQNPRRKSPNSARLHISKQRSNPVYVKSESHVERDLEFETGDTFFHHESARGRDLGVLSATLYKNQNQITLPH
ncbi:unnamed protein product [Cochlearia groenlandica]